MCGSIPAQVGESTKGQKHGKAAIDAALAKSERARDPKHIRTLEEIKASIKRDGVIEKERPKSVIKPEDDDE